jgi:hypothetical protein
MTRLKWGCAILALAYLVAAFLPTHATAPQHGWTGKEWVGREIFIVNFLLVGAMLWHASAKAGLLEINPDSNDIISAERTDPDALDCDSAGILLASIYFHLHYHVLRHAGFRCVVAEAKELFCIKELTAIASTIIAT